MICAAASWCSGNIVKRCPGMNEPGLMVKLTNSREKLICDIS